MSKKNEIGVSVEKLIEKGTEISTSYGVNRDRVLNFLKRNENKGFTQKQIMNELNKNKNIPEVSEQQVNNALRSLSKKNLVLRKRFSINEDGKMKNRIHNFINPNNK